MFLGQRTPTGAGAFSLQFESQGFPQIAGIVISTWLAPGMIVVLLYDWTKPQRVIAKAEWSANPRLLATALHWSDGGRRKLYADIYLRVGNGEPHRGMPVRLVRRPDQRRQHARRSFALVVRGLVNVVMAALTRRGRAFALQSTRRVPLRYRRARSSRLAGYDRDGRPVAPWKRSAPRSRWSGPTQRAAVWRPRSRR